MFTAIGGISIVGATLPGLVKAIGFFANEAKKKNRYPKVKIKNSFEYLKKKQFIEIVKEKSNLFGIYLCDNNSRKLITHRQTYNIAKRVAKMLQQTFNLGYELAKLTYY